MRKDFEIIRLHPHRTAPARKEDDPEAAAVASRGS